VKQQVGAQDSGHLKSLFHVKQCLDPTTPQISRRIDIFCFTWNRHYLGSWLGERKEDQAGEMSWRRHISSFHVEQPFPPSLGLFHVEQENLI
jgi:hypothetical protein